MEEYLKEILSLINKWLLGDKCNGQANVGRRDTVYPALVGFLRNIDCREYFNLDVTLLFDKFDVSIRDGLAQLE